MTALTHRGEEYSILVRNMTLFFEVTVSLSLYFGGKLNMSECFSQSLSTWNWFKERSQNGRKEHVSLASYWVLQFLLTWCFPSSFWKAPQKLQVKSGFSCQLSTGYFLKQLFSFEATALLKQLVAEKGLLSRPWGMKGGFLYYKATYWPSQEKTGIGCMCDFLFSAAHVHTNTPVSLSVSFVWTRPRTLQAMVVKELQLIKILFSIYQTQSMHQWQECGKDIVLASPYA